MKKANLFVLITMATMLVSLFASLTFSTGPTQPPVETSTLYVGGVAWGPRYADPVIAYDTASNDLLFNCYERLISMGEPVSNRWNENPWDAQEQYWKFSPSLSMNVPDRANVTKTVTNTTRVNLANPIDTVWSDNSTILNWVDSNDNGLLDAKDVIYMHEVNGSYRTWFVQSATTGATVTLNLWRGSYTFQMRISPVINFYNSSGLSVDTFDVLDAEYSFKRGLVQDQYGSPMWMFYKPFFDQMNCDFWYTVNPIDAVTLSHLIDNAVEVSGNDLVVNVAIPFPDIAFKQVLAQTWGSIVSKEWAIGMGCWNGDLFTDSNSNGTPDWFEPYPIGWRHVSAGSVPINAIAPENYAGTGPYHVITANSTLNLVVLQRNPEYWGGWPAPNRKAYLEYVDIEYITDWATRREAFKAGQLDVAAIPRSNMLELLDPADSQRMTPIPGYPGIKTIKNISPVLTEDNMFFTFTLSPTTPAIYTGVFPTGIPPNFFNNVHVRRAFAYAFNHSKYLNEVYLGEAVARETVNIYGLVPDYYSLGPDPPWTYDKNLARMQSELQQAYFKQGATNQSVWDWGGFKLDIFYNSGNDPRRLACEFIQASFSQLNTASGKNFQVVVQGLDFTTYLSYVQTYKLPIWFIGWLADFSDADNLVRPYMHSYGDFSYFQNYSITNGWTTPGPRTGMNKDRLIDLAVKTPDGPNRANMYADLDYIFVNDVPNIPVAQGTGRRWQWYWVKGWYYNPLFPSDCYYRLYKEGTCWADAIGVAPSYLPDGITNMRDIAFIAGHYGAKSPDTAKTQPYDVNWAPGTYGTSCADVYGDRKVDMRDVGLACAHFVDSAEP